MHWRDVLEVKFVRSGTSNLNMSELQGTHQKWQEKMEQMNVLEAELCN
jgi:hypothetical protein